MKIQKSINKASEGCQLVIQNNHPPKTPY